MLEELKYINHLNESYSFGSSGIFVETSDIHDFEWEITTKNNKIASFNYGIAKRKLPIKVKADSAEECARIKNRIFEISEKDVLSQKHGRIVIGDYYFRCFVTASKKKDYLTDSTWFSAELTLTTDFPYWIKETKLVFRKIGEIDINGESGKNLDYPHDFPFDFFSGMGNKKFENTSFVPVNFRMTIYGACIEPKIYIQGHKYQIHETLVANEHITIDSISKTITKTDSSGVQTNIFNSRERDSYIFEKIPVGQNSVTWSGDYGIDIVLCEERSEPKWI